MFIIKDNTIRQIKHFIENNFGSWIVNIRTEFRIKKFWEYTQSVYITKSLEEGKSLIDAVAKKVEKI